MFVFSVCVCVWEAGTQIFGDIFLLRFCFVVPVLSRGKAGASVWYLCRKPVNSVCISFSLRGCVSYLLVPTSVCVWGGARLAAGNVGYVS